MQNDESQQTGEQSGYSTTSPLDDTSESRVITSDQKRRSRTYQLPVIPRKAWVTVLAVLVVAALGYGAYWYIINERRMTATNANQVITRLKLAIPGGATSTTSGATLPSYQPSGYSFAVQASSASTIKFTVSPAKLTTTYQKIAHILDLENLTKPVVPSTQATSTPNTHYQNASVHCSLTTSQPTKDWTLQVSCANDGAYAAAAAQMKQFHDLYVANNPSVTGSIDVSQVDIQPSRSEGYKIAQAIVFYGNGNTGAPVSYYQTPDGTWHYFRASPAFPGCNELNTPDLRKAYLGQTCYSNTAGRLTTVAL